MYVHIDIHIYIYIHTHTLIAAPQVHVLLPTLVLQGNPMIANPSGP